MAKYGWRRWVALVAGVTLQFCLGAVYAWSVYVPALRADYGWSAGSAQFVFGLSIAMFTVTTIIAGRLLERFSARWVALAGAMLFSGGYLLAASGEGLFLPVLCGIGVMAGVGIGFGYLSVLSTAIAWFPNYKGLVTGVAVTGFGVGAILLAELVPDWIASGLRVPAIFQMIGLRYGVVTCLAALLLFQAPAPAAVKNAVPDATWWSPLRHRAFWTLAVGLFCGTFAGLLVVGNLKPIGLSAGLETMVAASAISFFAIGNALGRLVWGWGYDKIGCRTIPLSLFFLAVMVFLLHLMAGTAMGFRWCALFCGIGFGACFVLYAAQTSEQYGAAGLGRVYPLLFLCYGISGITGPPFGGFLFDVTGTFGVPIVVSVLMLAAGGLVCWGPRFKSVNDSVKKSMKKYERVKTSA